MILDFTTFRGELPKLSEKLLPNDFASSAINCDLRHGNLQPVKGTLKVQDLQSDTLTVWKMVNKWLEWDDYVTIAKSTMSPDSYRIIYAPLSIGVGDYPKETNTTIGIPGSSPYPNAERRLGITPPIAAPSVAATTGGTDTYERESSYVYTIVGVWEDDTVVESAPSPASDPITIAAGERCIVSGLTDSIVSGEYTTHFRIYRLVVGEVGAEYQYVTQIAKAGSSYTDDNSDNDIAMNEVIETTNWTPPNVDIWALIATSYGLFFGFDDNNIYVSESFIPYAYPDDYTLKTNEIIKGFGATQSAVICLTRGYPYMILGQDPQSLSLHKLPHKQACLSQRSIVSMPQGVVYASPDGLFMITPGGGGQMLTENTWTKEQWQEKSPGNIFAFHYDDYYLFFIAGTTEGYALNLSNGEVKEYELSGVVRGGHYVEEEDILYLIQADGGGGYDLVKWEYGTYLSYTWQSKLFESLDYEVFTAMRVIGDFTNGYPTISLYGDGNTLLLSKIIKTSGQLIRMARTRVKQLKVKVTGKATIDRIIIGSSPKEVYDVR